MKTFSILGLGFVFSLPLALGVGAYQAITANVANGCPAIPEKQYQALTGLPEKAASSKSAYDLLMVAQNIENHARDLDKKTSGSVISGMLYYNTQDAYFFATNLKVNDVSFVMKRNELVSISLNLSRLAYECHY
jgi:hypothetical protein